MSPMILITGASRGIGLAAAKFILADGAKVIALQRTIIPALEALSTKYPGAIQIIKGDFTKPEDISSALASLAGDSLDAVVLNAAVGEPFGTIATMPLDSFRVIFDVNFFGVVQFLQLALPKLREAKGKVVFVSSTAGEIGAKGLGAYGASKAALNQLNRTLAVEEPDITSIAFHPGVVRTEMAAAIQRDGKDHMDPAVVGMLAATASETDVPGRGIRNLVLRAETEYSGKYLYFDDPLVTSL
ncbi:NAD(P)-binding protein [Exidia glandulosa HHB12029]|uniref:NAD(P)-binding protein n=1 Tax=Exidia glandulosa HHB12029 TaxID=1314781 RepID=A0A165Z794_EXIGL|nr:NAD(P)-binding protein [Exidia glandulosa HHB12029]